MRATHDPTWFRAGHVGRWLGRGRLDERQSGVARVSRARDRHPASYVLSRLLGCALASVTATACSLPGMEFAVDPLGGFDDDGAGDQLYFDLQNVSGFAAGEWVLVLPEDWRERATRPDEAGAVGLVEPLEPRWVPLADAAPALERERGSTPHARPGKPGTARLDERLLVAGGQRLDAAGVLAMAAARARAGRDFYFVTRRSDEGVRRYVLYGAAPARHDEDTERRLVRLCDLAFYDQRHLLVRGLDLGVRVTTGAAGVVLFLPVLVVGTLLQGDPTK